MKKMGINLCLLIAFFVGQSASAGFMIEPYVGVGVGASVKEEGNNDDPKAGMLYGARLGVSFAGFMLGGEYESLSSKVDSEALGFELKSATNSYGLFLGYELPIMFRFYATYFLNVESITDDYSATVPPFGTVSINNRTRTGSGLKLGLSYTGLPFLCINLEMSKQTYDEESYDIVTGIGSTSVEGEIDSEVTVTQLTISLPLP